MLRRALALLVLLALPLALAAYPDPAAPAQRFASGCLERHDRRFVYDYLGWFDSTLGQEQEGGACEVYEKTGSHVVLVLLNNTAGESLEGYAVHLFETWGIGDRDRHDGALVLYVDAFDEAGAAVRVEVGYGLEPVLTGHVSAEAVRLMRDAKQRSLDAGDGKEYATSFGLASGSLYLMQTILDRHEGVVPQARFVVPEWFWVLMVFLLIAAVQVLIVTASTRRGRAGWGYRHSPGWGTGYPRRWGGGSGGFGGGGFGGGGFGGGGGGFGGGRSGGGGGSGRI